MAATELTQRADTVSDGAWHANQVVLQSADYDELARLHLHCLPDSILSELGYRAVRAFYKYVERSHLEYVCFARHKGNIVAGCVFSFRPWSLSKRLLVNTSISLLIIKRLPLIIKACGTRPKRAPREELKDTSFRYQPEIMHLFTTPHFRGKGIAKCLIAQCVGRARAAGCARVIARTLDHPTNPAIYFYRKNGFVEIGSVHEYGKWLVVFAKEIV
jgi:GNAT superfamily N-acetyltransferase